MYVPGELAKFVLCPAEDLVIARVETGRDQGFDVRSVLIVCYSRGSRLLVARFSPRFCFYPVRSQVSAILLDLLATIHCLEDSPANWDIPRSDSLCLCIRESKLGKEYGDDVLAVQRGLANSPTSENDYAHVCKDSPLHSQSLSSLQNESAGIISSL